MHVVVLAEESNECATHSKSHLKKLYIKAILFFFFFCVYTATTVLSRVAFIPQHFFFLRLVVLIERQPRHTARRRNKKTFYYVLMLIRTPKKLFPVFEGVLAGDVHQLVSLYQPINSMSDKSRSPFAMGELGTSSYDVALPHFFRRFISFSLIYSYIIKNLRQENARWQCCVDGMKEWE